MPRPSAVRVLLINPPSPERLGAPLLGQQYLAAAALAAGAEVRVLDAAARHAHLSLDDLVAAADAFDPHVVGVGLFTRWVWHAYALVDALRGRFPLLVAGGPHATARPEEALARGFDVAVVGEGERAIADLVQVAEGRKVLAEVPGLVVRGDDGRAVHTPPAELLRELDTLPYPHDAQHLYDPAWYHPGGHTVTPGGILTSRGCPARCTFCANHVTGRIFRHHGAARVVEELNTAHARFGSHFFPCWDDALTANRRRLRELCDALEEGLDFELAWSAITRADLVTEDLLRRMQEVGLVMVNFGVESGDDDVLRAIGKGVGTARVDEALTVAKGLGLSTAANFMLGFPEDTPSSLERTLAFLAHLAPRVDTFSTLGVLIPFPATPVYELHHARFGFTDWWLDPRYAAYAPPPPMRDREAWHRWYVDDATLELDFFHYDDARRDLIREALRFKAEHNLRAMGWSASSGQEPPRWHESGAVA
ncbi:MAG: B12-binding domain-containing radical SAM protein [Alphaproteobacteria bacterium]|nr:B12-binding domain-containing radical SAM protein [Alphaproteobacteria bacterium]